MTRGQMQRAMDQQRKLADQYLAEADTLPGDHPRVIQLYRLWSMHDTNAKVWLNTINRR